MNDIKLAGFMPAFVIKIYFHTKTMAVFSCFTNLKEEKVELQDIMGIFVELIIEE